MLTVFVFGVDVDLKSHGSQHHALSAQHRLCVAFHDLLVGEDGLHPGHHVHHHEDDDVSDPMQTHDDGPWIGHAHRWGLRDGGLDEKCLLRRARTSDRLCLNAADVNGICVVQEVGHSHARFWSHIGGKSARQTRLHLCRCADLPHWCVSTMPPAHWGGSSIGIVMTRSLSSLSCVLE